MYLCGSAGSRRQAPDRAGTPSASDIETAALSENPQEPDAQALNYEDLIEAASDFIMNKDLEAQTGYDFSIALLSSGGSPGYLIKDIDGNGTDELIFGENVRDPQLSPTWDGVIYDIYTISDGALIHVLNGWERSRYYLCENGMIAHEGSSGAANFNYAYFTFERWELHLKESVIYDGMRDADHPWFYSTESPYDAKNAEPISENRSMEIREAYTYEHPDFIPFTEENRHSGSSSVSP